MGIYKSILNKKARHLKLVVSNPPKNETITNFFKWLNEPRFFEIKLPFVKTQEEKIEELRKFYSKKYRLEDLQNSESINIPYFIRVEQKIKEIINSNTIDYEYKTNCRFNKNYTGCI